MAVTHDAIYATPREGVEPFRFDEQVVKVFPDMITRSVPGYTLTLPLIGLIAARYSQPHTNCYDLGCSLGAATFAMRQQIRRPGCRIIAVDNSSAMIKRCREILAIDENSVPVDLIESDIQDVEIVQASVVVINFTLQFIDLAVRDVLIRRIYNGMMPGGVLILSEKVLFTDATQNQRMIDVHHDYKRANGYSDLEISQKRTALENVLVPETIAVHQKRMQTAGFSSAEVWFQAFNFMSMMAIK
ncbi:MAG: carboxy-S-adenosyl-L-methionine synthase CmoA [Chloroflexi bacterium]|nr:carboxy-S-adenosyl-L-methionine synthase CmoA [Chloroflexota bacterium]